MNCRDFELNVRRLAHGGLINAAVRQQALAHAEVCASCACRLKEEEAFNGAVRVVMSDLTSEQAPARVEVSLVSAFRTHVAATSARAIPIQAINPSSIPHIKVAAAAASIVVMLSLTALLTLRWKWSPKSYQVHTVISPLPTLFTPKGATVTENRELARAAGAVRRGISRRRHLRPQAAEVEVVTQFFPLTEDDIGSAELAQVVRVELPGSAMIDVGLPVDSEMASKRVKADVLLGSDGIARAIRFVR